MAYALTKLDIAALRQGDRICVSLDKNGARVRVTKEIKRNERNPFAQDVEHLIETPVSCRGNQRVQEALANGAHCFASVSFYHSQNTHESCIIKSLREGDEVTFEFYPDCHSNGYVAKAGLHADALFLRVTRGKNQFRYELDQSICPDNSARMCRNVPSQDWYHQSAA